MAGENTENKNFLGMSDDDFLNATPPPVEAAPAGQASEVAENDKDEAQPAKVEAEVVAADPKKDEPAEKVDEGKKADVDAGDVDEEDEAAKADEKSEDKAKAAEPAKDDAAKPADGAAKPKDEAKPDAKTEVKADEKAVDYEGFFKQVMKPFKANGRTIELKTPDEAIRLMQMGAGYGRKIQDLQPALKTLKMLEKANLLDEGQLSFLIDVHNKNPDAIKKLIKESGIDPLDLNIEDNVQYKPTSHSVSDTEMAFHTVVDDLKSSPQGVETLRIVNQTWDQDSKSALWSSPELLTVIQSQRDNGIYDQIAAEIDRQKLLGQIAPNTPFLQAYKLAGDALQKANAFVFKDEPTATPAVIATRAEAPKAQVKNSDKAKAAAPTKEISSRKADTKINPLSMADDDFLKTFKDRL